MKKNSLISTIRGNDDRYEISPTLKLLFSAEEIVALSQRYAAERFTGAVGDEAVENGEDNRQDEAR